MRPSVRGLAALCGPQGTGRGPALKTECPSLVSDHGGGGTPGPIPNPEVKPPSADGTAEQSVGEQDVADQRGAFAVCRPSRHRAEVLDGLFFYVDWSRLIQREA